MNQIVSTKATSPILLGVKEIDKNNDLKLLTGKGKIGLTGFVIMILSMFIILGSTGAPPKIAVIAFFAGVIMSLSYPIILLINKTK